MRKEDEVETLTLSWDVFSSARWLNQSKQAHCGRRRKSCFLNIEAVWSSRNPEHFQSTASRTAQLLALCHCFSRTHRLTKKWGGMTGSWWKPKTKNYISQNLYYRNTLTKVQRCIYKNFHCDIFHYIEKLDSGSIDKLWCILTVEFYVKC